LRKSEEKKGTASIGVNRPNCWEGKKKIDKAEAPGGKKCLCIIGTGALTDVSISLPFSSTFCIEKAFVHTLKTVEL